MPVRVGKGVDAARSIANENERLAEHLEREVVTRMGDLVLATDEIPRPPEYAVDFPLVELLGCVAPWRQCGCLQEWQSHLRVLSWVELCSRPPASSVS